MSSSLRWLYAPSAFHFTLSAPYAVVARMHTSRTACPGVSLSYDIDNDGYISNAELFTVLKMMTGDNLNDEQLQQIVDKTIIDAVGSAVCHVAVMRWPRWPASTKRMDRLMSLCVHQSGWFSRRPCDRRQPIYCQRLALTGLALPPGSYSAFAPRGVVVRTKMVMARSALRSSPCLLQIPILRTK
jgi:hypothetical protein